MTSKQRNRLNQIARSAGLTIAKSMEAIEKIILETAANPNARSVNFIKAQRAKVLQAIYAHEQIIIPSATRAVLSSYQIGSINTRDRISAFLGLANGQPFSATEQQALQFVIETTTNRIKDADASVVKRTDELFRKLSMEQAYQFTAPDTYKTSAEILKQSLVDSNLTWTGTIDDGADRLGIRLMELNGKNYDLSKYTEMVIKTETSNAHTQGVKTRMLENGLDVVEVTEHGSTCDICGPYEGNKYSLTGSTPGLPILDVEPPFHPNCEHLITASVV
jgi:hypothetical protein